MGIHVGIGKISKRPVSENFTRLGFEEGGHERRQVEHRIGIGPTLAFHQRLGGARIQGILRKGIRDIDVELFVRCWFVSHSYSPMKVCLDKWSDPGDGIQIKLRPWYTSFPLLRGSCCPDYVSSITNMQD